MKKIIMIVTVPVVLETWLKGQPGFLSRYYDVEIITSDSDTIKQIQKYEGVSIKVMDISRQINLFKDIKVLVLLYFYLLKSKPFMVYTLTPKAGLLGMISSWIARIPHRIHNIVGLPHLEAIGKRRIVLEITERITYLFSSKLYCNSLNLKKTIEQMTTKPVNIIANGSVNGVDTRYFNDVSSIKQKKTVLDKLHLHRDDFIITFVGRIVKDKGINELLSVFDTLCLKHKSIKLLLIGDYKNESDPISQKSQKTIKYNKSIIYLEFQEDIREYLAITSLFVLPSYREGLPNVLIEAGSYGIPLIATNINGCDEVIQNNINGVLVDKKNEKQLSVAIERFLLDTVFFDKLKNNIRESIVSRYDQKYFWSKLLEEFKTIEKGK